ncbi:MAG TPA: GNAT family N-acetyltransferase [Pirellulales bacterium]|nr:GNAT family N-acetyltransferase [Pirellulales bacterium]
MNYRLATLDDIALLAAMNQELIRDEGHRNTMSLSQLQDRMRGWLQDEYRAVIFEDEGEAAGYALFRHESDWTYLRQFYVLPSKRRRGIGRKAVQWLRENEWSRSPRVRLEVLIGNSVAIQFWRSLGFSEYCLTMERDARSALPPS